MKQYLLVVLMVVGFSPDLFAQLELQRLILNPAGYIVNNQPLAPTESSRLEWVEPKIGIIDLANILAEEGLELIQENSNDPTENVEGRFVGELLNYPNPFSVSRQTTEIGFRLIGRMDVELRLYSMTGHLITKQEYFMADNDLGTRDGYNAIPVDDDFLDGRYLTPGIYFYVLISDGKVLAKQKMAVLP